MVWIVGVVGLGVKCGGMWGVGLYVLWCSVSGVLCGLG